jgi:nitrite reductase (NADH) small subunit/3-phenylpropionate/trans-cinnamate dioxygenase ferredoxin subunit
MGEYVKVGKLDDFREGRGVAVRLNGGKVAIFKVDGRLRAIQDRCPHMGASLADGRVQRGQVVCHWHDWCFDLQTGQGDRRSKRWLRARVYEVKIEGDEVFVLRPDESASGKSAEEDWVPWDDGYLKE